MSSFEVAVSESLTIPLIIDGGLATQLESQNHKIETNLWSAELLRTDPQAIIAAHLAYLEAGADVIISASYQASRSGFTSLTTLEADELIESSVKLAKHARDQFLSREDVDTNSRRKPFVAASIGPYGAAQADGSEYTGLYNVSDSDLRLFQRQKIQLLDACGADALAVETIPCIQEARVLAEELLTVKTPAWVTFCCKDDKHLSDGSLLSAAASLFDGHPRVVALGVNCTKPSFVPSLVKEIQSTGMSKAIIVYPNSGENWDLKSKCWHGMSNPDDSADAAVRWRQGGASLIGGCCRMGPGHIKAMRDRLFST